ncbi:MAG: hypothetical protein MH204_09235 [Fimbriimonadaceae bacterium]|nr:hypothetical protein [Fimbriimonadaceae bacterium]
MSPLTLRIRPDKIASVCLPFHFGPGLSVSPQPECREGTAVVCRVVSARSSYGELELLSGRTAKLIPGDVIVGVLGNRAALRGFSGRVPSDLAVGDTVHLLNMGGVVGISEGSMVGLGEPIRLEVLGTPMIKGAPARLGDHAIRTPEGSDATSPLIAVAGTCMNSGKSTAASVLIRRFKSEGRLIHAGKATGVAAIRDPMSFRDHGAALSLSFLDCGIPSTAYRTDMPEVAGRLVARLMEEGPDAVVLELGDGLLGAYGVDEILESDLFRERCTTVILAANDVVGGVAGVERLRGMGLHVSVVTGPATDNLAGVARLEGLGIPAANIMREPEKFGRLVQSRLHEAHPNLWEPVGAESE